MPTAEPHAEERRLVTVLFADVSGFTALAERLDPEQLVEVMDPILGAMAAVVERYEGQINKFAGDAVLAYFGAPVAHDDDAIRALLAAAEIQRDVTELVQELPPVSHDLALHMGVNTGHVVTGSRGGGVLDYSLLGDAVNVAQRLESASPAGEIYVGDATHALARHRFEFESVGDLTLKGKAEPVRAWRLLTGPDGPVAARPSHEAGVATLVGRDAEVERLRAVLDGLAHGSPTLLAFVGEPGVGKTRLLEEAQRSATELGIGWYRTRCLSYGSGLPYWPYAELLRGIAGIDADDATDVASRKLHHVALSVGAAGATPYLAHLVGAGDEDEIAAGVRNSPEALRHRVHGAVASFVAGLAGRSPVVLAIEDVHWMDNASQGLTEHIARSCRHVPLGLAVTGRPEAQSYVDGLTAAADRSAAVLDLARLDEAAVAALVEELLSGRAEPDLLRTVVDRTGGNPLFVRELVRSLQDADADAGSAGPSSAAQVPPTIESVLAARIDLLPRPAAELLQAASVIGRQVPMTLLQPLVGGELRDLADRVDLLVDRGLFVRDGSGPEESYEFSHALILDVAYHRLLRRRRRELHRQLVDLASERFGTGDDVIDLMAHHAYLGGMGAVGLPHVRRAAARAAAMFANTEAASHLAHAIEMAESDPDAAADVPELLLEAATLEERTGNYARALELFERAREQGGGGAGWLGHARVVATMGGYREALAELDQAAESASSMSDVDLGLIETGRGRMLGSLGDFPAARTVLAAAAELLGRAGHPAEADALVELARVNYETSTEAAIEAARGAVRAAEAVGDMPRLATALRVLGGALQVSGDPVAALSTLERAHAVVQQTGQAEEHGAIEINLGRAREFSGDHAGALKHYEQALELFTMVGIRGGVAASYCNIASVQGHLSDYEAAERAASQGLAVAEEIGHQYWVAGALIGLGEVALVRGDWERARELGERALSISAALDDPDRVESSRDVVRRADAQERPSRWGPPVT